MGLELAVREFLALLLVLGAHLRKGDTGVVKHRVHTPLHVVGQSSCRLVALRQSGAKGQGQGQFAYTLGVCTGAKTHKQPVSLSNAE